MCAAGVGVLPGNVCRAEPPLSGQSLRGHECNLYWKHGRMYGRMMFSNTVVLSVVIRNR